MILNTELINTLLHQADNIPSMAMKFKEYTSDVFNYKPAGWSAAECIEHLIIINEAYIPVFENISRIYTSTGEKEFRNSFVGKFLIKAIHPDARRKVKTSPLFQPKRSEAGLSIVDEYLQQHRTLRSYIEQFRDFDLKKIKITSPMTSMVKYNLGDACIIIIYHDLRHLKQAQRAVESYYNKVNNETQ